jgi:16S rRNA (cytosine967-C5)-methyltransferase
VTIPRSVSAARRLAFSVLSRVEAGAHASDLLHREAAGLQPSDAGLATEIVMGCLRRQRQVDWLIERQAGRDPAALDVAVRIALRMGVYQIVFLDRIPRYAAVNESVECARGAGKGAAAGLVNAVLRRVPERPGPWPSPAVELNLPGWMWQKWSRQFGARRARAIAQSLLEPPETYIRVRAGREEEAVALGAEPTYLDGCYRLTGRDPGPFRIQDIGSQSIVPLVELAAGHRFLDIASAPGNKTAQALETIGIQAVACDVDRVRLASLREEGGARPGCQPCLVLTDGRALPFGAVFDRVLLDAPCSGTGTLRRNPEIKWRVSLPDMASQARRQKRMLSEALDCLRPGGRLVYSTCSLEPEENEEVVQEVLRRAGESVRLVKTVRRIPGEDPGDGFFAAVLGSEKPGFV